MTSSSQFEVFPVSVHVFFFRDDAVLMLRREGTGFGDGLYSVPAGHVTHRESIFAAAVREAREEVGLEVSTTELRFLGSMYRFSTEARIDFFFAAERWSGEPINKEPEKCNEVTWFRTSQLPDNTVPYIRRALNRSAKIGWFEEYEP